MGARVAIALPAASLGLAQPSDTSPTFIAADVHPSPHSTSPNVYMTGTTLRGSRYDIRNATMVDLIRTALRTDPEKIVGGPNWLEFDPV